MNNLNIIVIGAGAAGLMAARLLAKAGNTVTILEARRRTGGRIHTIDNVLKDGRIELGAEFIHGDLPVTLALLKEAGIGYEPAGGEMWRYQNGIFSREEEQMEGWDELMTNLRKLKADTDLDSFLQQYFPGQKYEPLKTSVRNYVAGYDTAEPDKASAFALRNEWQNEDDEAQHRLNNGYCQMITYLEKEIETAGGRIILNSPVSKISWEAGSATVSTIDNKVYQAQKILLALPLGVLQLKDKQPGHITFEPALPVQENAFTQIGFGAIIKILLEFDAAFWEHNNNADMENMAFLFSGEKIPTWWTQAPGHRPVLTGWLGGPAARQMANASDNQLFEIALTSLSHIYGFSVEELKSKLTGHHIMNWTAHPFTLGSYAYDMVGSQQAREVLNSGVSNTLFFTGEYLYGGPAMGTVEAALTSAKYITAKIME